MPVDGERQTGARVDDDVDEALRCSCVPDAADVRLRVASIDAASLLSDFRCFCCCCCCCGEYFMSDGLVFGSL